MNETPDSNELSLFLASTAHDMKNSVSVLAGTLENNQANVVRWIRDPQSIDPHTAMPDMGVSERDAIDMSAYLLMR